MTTRSRTSATTTPSPMQIADLFRRRRDPLPSAPDPCPCRVPGHRPIRGDGPPVCPVLVYRAGDAAARPAELSEGVLSMLQEVHGDVVELVEVRLPRGRVLVWRWVMDPEGGIA